MTLTDVIINPATFAPAIIPRRHWMLVLPDGSGKCMFCPKTWPADFVLRVIAGDKTATVELLEKCERRVE